MVMVDDKMLKLKVKVHYSYTLFWLSPLSGNMCVEGILAHMQLVLNEDFIHLYMMNASHSWINHAENVRHNL